MAFTLQTLNYLYYIIGIITFIFGFLLVANSLKRIRRIERKPFNAQNILTCIIFGTMFALAIVFAINITLDFISPIPIPGVEGYVFFILLGFLAIYPIFDILNLAKPTSDSITEFHHILESKIIDKVGGVGGYFVAIGVYLVLYIVPVIIVNVILKSTLIELLFIWFLLFPLFYLSMYAAQGQISNIRRAMFLARIPTQNLATKNFISPMQKMIGKINVLIAVVPFVISVYDLVSPIVNAIRGVGFGTENVLLSYLSLFSTVVFGIQGFFSRYWSKKSKTKSYDFYFSGYIIIAIVTNMLINFISIDPTVVQGVFDVSIFGYQPLSALGDLINNYNFIVPVITVQSAITVAYGIRVFLQRDSEFNANIYLAEINRAFKLPTDVDILKEEKRIAKTGKIKQIPDEGERVKARQVNYLTLLKVLNLHQVHNKFKVDIYEELRFKAAKILYLISEDEPKRVADVVEFIANETISHPKNKKNMWLSPEAFRALGLIGKRYPKLVLKRLLDALPNADLLTKRYIIEAIGIIGQVEANIKFIIQEGFLLDFLKVDRFDLKSAAFEAINAMGVGLSDISILFERYYEILQKSRVIATSSENSDEEHEEEEYMIEKILESILKIGVNDPTKIQLDQITPFLWFKSLRDNHESENYIQIYSLKLLRFLALYSPDEIPIDTISSFLEDDRYFIRKEAVRTIGNYCLQKQNDDLLTSIMNKGLFDTHKDVREACIDALYNYISEYGHSEINIQGHPIGIVTFYLDALESPDQSMAEHASEALMKLGPLVENMDEFNRLNDKVQSSDEIVARQCIYTLSRFKPEFQQNINIDKIFQWIEKGSDRTKADLIWVIGELTRNLTSLQIEPILKWISYKEDILVKFNAILALQKFGLQNPEPVIAELTKLLESRDVTEKSQELELIYESLGKIGQKYPFYQIIVILQKAIMEDTNPFSIDVVAQALYNLGKGFIQKEGEEFIHTTEKERLVKYRYPPHTQEYRIGDIILILLEALQQKGYPDTALKGIAQAIEDLLPYYLFLEQGPHRFEILDTIDKVLRQAYYSNYSHEILDVMARISSLKAFRLIFDTQKPIFQKQFRLLSLQYNPDGNDFNKQALYFLEHLPNEKEIVSESFKIALELDSDEAYAPQAHYEIAKIYRDNNDYPNAITELQYAMHLFAYYNDIAKFKEVKNALQTAQQK